MTTDTIIANHHAGLLSTAEKDARLRLAGDAVTERELADLTIYIPGPSKAPVRPVYPPYYRPVVAFSAALLAFLAGGVLGSEAIASLPGWGHSGLTAEHVWAVAVVVIGAIVGVV